MNPPVNEGLNYESQLLADSRYRCCCSRFHVEQGTRIIAFLSTIGIVASIISVWWNPLELRGSLHAIQILGLLIEVLAVVFMILGVRQQQERLLLPYLVYMGMWMFVALNMIVLSFWILFSPNSNAGRFLSKNVATKGESETEEHQGTPRGVAFLVAFILILGELLSFWWGYVVLQCYRYYKDLKRVKLVGDAVTYTTA